MSKRSDHIKHWRENTKARIVKAFGGSCCICNYNKCNDALELHHIDPTTKDFSIGFIMSHIISWKRICEELKKCIMVCSNCHKEIHANLTDLPENTKRFDETFINYKEEEHKKYYDLCPICGKEKRINLFTCSKECGMKRRGLFDWSKYDIVDMIDNQKLTQQQISEIIGCSHATIWKRYKKLKGGREHLRKFEISKEELEKMIIEMPMTKIAERFGVRDNSIRKRAKSLGIKIPKHLGYWQKIKSQNKQFHRDEAMVAD